MLRLFRIPHRKYLILLGLLFLVAWIVLAIDPYDRKDWALENALVLGFVIFLGFTARRLPFSRISYTLMFLFLVLHEIGAHYTYANVPYDAWCEALFGRGLNAAMGWERNHFDRLVHFSYGLLLAYPIREIYFRIARAEGFWGYFLPLDFTMASSMLYELIEWGAAAVFGGELGAAYLGTQGDVWDAHKDMALASLGALAAMLITMALNLYLQKDFAREWSESLRIKESRPLGEDEIARLWLQKNPN